jgi:hypothetical protein
VKILDTLKWLWTAYPLGTIKTMVIDREDIDSTGVFGHVAIGAGLALGKHREVDLGFNYLVHPGQSQIGGGLVLGMTIPL